MVILMTTGERERMVKKEEKKKRREEKRKEEKRKEKRKERMKRTLPVRMKNGKKKT